MIELVVLNGPDSGTILRPESGLCRVGRGADMPVKVSGPGVWDHHFVIVPGDCGRFEIRTAPGARVAIDDQFVEQGPLRNGDILVCGGLRLRFGLTAVGQRPLEFRERFTWLALVALVVMEGLVLRWVGH